MGNFFYQLQCVVDKSLLHQIQLFTKHSEW